MEKNQHTLLLKVTNPQLMQSGKKSEHYFSINGGTIGSAATNDWVLQDINLNVAESQARLDYQDGAFFISLSGGKTIYINGSEIGSHQRVKLQYGDKAQIGKLNVNIHTGSNPEAFIDILNTQPTDIIHHRDNPLEALLSSHPATQSQHSVEEVQDNVIIDPLKAIDADSLSSVSHFHDTDAPLPASAPQPQRYDYNLKQETTGLNTGFLDMKTYGNNGDNRLAGNSFPPEMYLAIAPLLRGLGVSLDIENTDEANVILEELGQTIRASIDGLLKLQKSKNILNHKNLRAIEDNPLRLNQNYEDTIASLFSSTTCSVHLSAPVAVAESLDNIQLHNMASHTATQYALSAMLDAFSPEQLLSRFARYRHSPHRHEMDGNWSWQMFCSYYRELSSNRQTGFEKLFWEHYEQEYDRQVRKLNLERENHA
ncbi:MAG: type VI secretion system-associated FHA domain protein TagH [Enterobacteriaceae bacterium]|jgi:type VI secretion system protein ImpI|nr:type VI secretion system-associated FHA domain protein TagH [Enterobacteriaceae bacterium]